MVWMTDIFVQATKELWFRFSSSREQFRVNEAVSFGIAHSVYTKSQAWFFLGSPPDVDGAALLPGGSKGAWEPLFALSSSQRLPPMP